MRNYTTQMDAARRGIITPEMKAVAAKEYRTEEDFYKYFEYQWVKLKTKSKFDFIYKTEVEQLVKDFMDLGFPQYTVNGKKCWLEVPFDDLKNKF